MNQTWKNILVAALSAIFAFAGSYYIYSEQLKISKLDLHKDFDENYFSKPKFPSSDIILTVDTEEKEKLGLFQVSLVNYTTKDYLDIPIKIKITPKKVTEFKILAHSAVGQDEVSDLVVATKDMDFDGSSYNFSYEVSSINRTERSEYGMQLRILFEGTEEPKVSVVAKGVGVRDFDVNNSPYQKSVNIKAAFLGIGLILGIGVGMFILMVLILGPLISVFTKSLDVKSRKKYAKELFKVIKDNNLQPNKSDDDIANFVADMLYHRQCEWWNNKTPIGKWSLGLIGPDRNDHLVEV
jgi:hypothetical protein